MKKKMFSMLTAFVAAVLMLNYAALPGFALEEYNTLGIVVIEFSTELVLNDDAMVPDVTFNYTVSPGEAVEPTATTPEIFSGSAGAEAGKAVFSHTDEGVIGTDGKKTVSKTVSVSFPAGSFTRPGIYRYVLTQNNPGIAGLNVDSHSTRYIDITIADTDEDPNLEFWGGKIKYDNAGVIKSDRFVNTITQSDFTFSKSIAGNQGDKEKLFLFTIELTNAIPGKYVIDFNNTNVYSSDSDTLIDPAVSPQTIAVGADGKSFPHNYKLTEGSRVTVKNLNTGAKVTVTEDPEDYTPSWVVSAGGSGSDTTPSKTTTISNKNITVDFTNERHGIVPSGLFDISFVPYLIPLVIIIIVYVVVMIKKRKNNDDDDDDGDE